MLKVGNSGRIFTHIYNISWDGIYNWIFREFYNHFRSEIYNSYSWNFQVQV